MARLAQDVESRPVPADQLEFADEGAELIGYRFPDQRVRVAEDATGLRVAALAEIAHQPGAQALGLAHVNQVTVPAEHAVHAGYLGGGFSYAGPELCRLARSDAAEIRRVVHRSRGGWPEPSEGVNGE